MLSRAGHAKVEPKPEKPKPPAEIPDVLNAYINIADKEHEKKAIGLLKDIPVKLKITRKNPKEAHIILTDDMETKFDAAQAKTPFMETFHEPIETLRMVLKMRIKAAQILLGVPNENQVQLQIPSRR